PRSCRGRRHHLGRGRERAAQHRRRGSLHAEGFCARRHHGGPGPGGRALRRRARAGAGV
ncbi:MAG: Ethylmalonyl-CoA mutase, methylsuccinyl-CoA-forming, partial [uncultured Microvirga sp.]